MDARKTYYDRTVGVVSYKSDGCCEGYTLFSAHKATYLLDVEGRCVQEWRSKRNVFAAYLLESGNLVRDGSEKDVKEFFRTGGAAGYLEVVTWCNELVWWWTAEPRFSFLTHHDVEAISDGRVLVLCWCKVSEEEALKKGRHPMLLPEGEVWDNHIVELAAPFESFGEKPSQKNRRAVETWRWRQFDHIVQDVDPRNKETYSEDIEADWRRYDLNYCPSGGKARRRNSLMVGAEAPSGLAVFDPNHNLGITGEKDWLHANGISYDETRSLIMVSYCSTSEVVVVSRQTDAIVFRFGNPCVYRAGDPITDRVLFNQHSAQFVPNYNDDDQKNIRFIVFNNGAAPQRQWSTVDEYEFQAPYGNKQEESEKKTDKTTASTTSTTTSKDIIEKKKTNAVVSKKESVVAKKELPKSTLSAMLYPEAEPTAREKDAPSSCRLVWRHGPPVGHFGSFYAHHSSGVCRCPNGNTLVALGHQGILFEVTPSHEEVWRYVSPVEVRGEDESPSFVPQGSHRTKGKFGIFFARRYAIDYAAFRDKVLVPGKRLEERTSLDRGTVAKPISTILLDDDASLE